MFRTMTFHAPPAASSARFPDILVAGEYSSLNIDLAFKDPGPVETDMKEDLFLKNFVGVGIRSRLFHYSQFRTC